MRNKLPSPLFGKPALSGRHLSSANLLVLAWRMPLPPNPSNRQPLAPKLRISSGPSATIRSLLVAGSAFAAASIAHVALAHGHSQPAAADSKVVITLTGNTAAKAKLIAEKHGIAPGGTVALALAFDVAPQWHLYWNGINDSGMQPTIKLDLPASWTAGDIQWIAPERHITPGDIVDHVMQGQVTLIIRVTAPANAQLTDEATPLTIRGKADWLVCNEACLPGSADLAVILAVVANSEFITETSDAPVFAAARAKHPMPLPSDGSIVVKPGAGSVTFLSPGALGISFYPQAESRKPTDMVSGVSTECGTLTVAFDTDEADKPIRGVLEIIRAAPDGSTATQVNPIPNAGLKANPKPVLPNAAKASFAAKPLMSWYTISLPATKTAVPAKTEDGK